MKKIYLLLLASSLGFAGMNAQATLSYTHVSNDNDRLYYASPSMPDSQKIVTDAGLIPEVAQMGNSYSIPQYIVECLATVADLEKGDMQAVKDGTETRGVLPAGAKVTALSLPGRYQGGNSNLLVETTYLKSVGEDVLVPMYMDERYYDLDDIITNPANGFVKNNEPQECVLGAGDDDYLFSVGFDAPYIYAGGNLEVAVYLNVKDFDRGNNVMFDFAKTTAQAQNATIYHAYARGQFLSTQFNFYSGCQLDVEGSPVEAVLNYLALDENSLPAFHLDFYTNDLRGSAVAGGEPAAGREVTLYAIDEDNNLEPVGRATTDSQGRFVFENLDYTLRYVLGVDNELFADDVVDFGQNAIDNDIEVEITLSQLTAVNSLHADGTVTGVKYFNLSGMESDKPFDGVNVVVTRYANGCRKVTKLVK